MKYRYYNKVINVNDTEVLFTERTILQKGVVPKTIGRVLPGTTLPEYIIDEIRVENDDHLARLYEAVSHAEIDGTKLNRVCINVRKNSNT